MFGEHSKGAQVSREALYDQVWATPMTKVAKEYGISDVALAKICKKLNVPYPGRGYWRRKETGKTVKQKALRKLPCQRDTATGELLASS